MGKEVATKEQIIAIISESLADIEYAIGEHPADTFTLYENGKRSFVNGQARAEETEWSGSTGLTLEQLAIMHQYLFASSFIAAWYHIRGDKERRDKAAQPACILVSALGFNADDVMRQYIKYELVWRAAMKN